MEQTDRTAVTIVNPDGVVLAADAAFFALCGQAPDQVIARRLHMLAPFAGAAIDASLETALHTGIAQLQIDDLSLTLQRVENPNVRDSRRLIARVGTDPHIDPLTGLPDRVSFERRLNVTLDTARQQQRAVSLITFDLDDFKTFNDLFGYAFGDRLLCEVAERVGKVVRPHGFIARVGGDKFAALLDGADVAATAQRALDVIAEPISIADQTLYVSASMGIGRFPDDAADARELLNVADQAMNGAKEHGKNQFRFFAADARPQREEAFRLLNDLNKALEYDQLFLLYQPQFDLASRTFKGAEVLLRWQHPELGLIGPGRFISLAEINGMINPITDRIFIDAAERFKTLDAHGFDRFSLSINLSPRTLFSKDFDYTIDFFCKHYYLPEGRLRIEITENTFLKKVSDLIDRLNFLKARGIPIEIDDFGTGFTSLNYLLNLPVDTIKIDKSFVTGIDTDPKQREIFKAIVSMAHNLELDVIAEGVESGSEVEVLESTGCETIQGYYYSRPMPFDELLALLKQGGG